MSYICEFCGLRPENCGCSNESELEKPVIQRPYGLIDAPSPADFFSLLVEMESESKYDTPPSTPKNGINLLPPPKLERQTNRPSEQDLQQLEGDLFPEVQLIADADLSEFEIETNHYCETCLDFICDCERTQEDKDQLAREAYEIARDCGTYEYDRFCRDFPDEIYDELIKCPTCEEMIDPNDQNGMCYSCFTAEQRLYPDDIAMDLRYNNDRNSF